MPLLPRKRQRAFTLVEVMVVLLIVGILIAMAAVMTRGLVAGQNRSLTVTRMAGVDAALVQFVLQQKRLPCPADGTRASSDNNAGLETNRTAAGCGDQTNGVVPWRTLGLTETEATDGWGRRLTYRLRPAEAADNAMDASACDPAGTEAGASPVACTSPCLSTSLATCTPPSRYLTGRGLTVCDATPPVVAACPVARRLMDHTANPHTGAAYVMISHGASGGGARLNSGLLSATTATMDGTEEQKNYANQAYDAAGYYVDHALTETNDATHFDDLVSRPSVLNVLSRAGLAPRTH